METTRQQVEVPMFSDRVLNASLSLIECDVSKCELLIFPAQAPGRAHRARDMLVFLKKKEDDAAVAESTGAMSFTPMASPGHWFFFCR